jgi:hypothetical protein
MCFAGKMNVSSAATVQEVAVTLREKLAGKLVAGALVGSALLAGGLLSGGHAPTVHAQTPGPVVVADVVLGAGPAVPPNQICAIRSTFPQDNDIVFRVQVIDPATGAEMDNTELQSVTVTLPDGSVQNLSYGEHPPGPIEPKYQYWTYAFHIPADYPTGEFDYSITATDLQGNTYTPIVFPVGAPTVQIVPAGAF